MTLLLAAASLLPTDLNLFAEKVFSIVGFIALPLIAIVLISLLALMTFFVVGLLLELFGISISFPCTKKTKG